MSLTDNLISYWKLDEASGNALDAQGANALTDSNAVGSTTGKIGNARSFTRASSQCFSKASNSDLAIASTAVSYEFACWVQIGDNTTTKQIVTKRTQNQTGLGLAYMLRIDAAEPKVYWGTTDPSFGSVASGVTMTTNTWYWITFGFDSGAGEFFITVNNGAAVFSSAAASQVVADANPFQVGGSLSGTNEFHQGLIDEVGFWKGRTLTSGERTQLYNGGSGLAYSSFGGDTTPPTISSAAIGTAGTTLVWTASEAITAGAGGSGGVTLSATNGAVTATYASGTGTTTVTYNLSRTIGHGETVTHSYTQPGNGWEDGAGNDLASFSSAAVTNNSNRPAAPTGLAVAGVTSSSVNLTWTDNADNETAFVVEYDTVNTFDQGPTDVTLNTGDVQSDSVLTLAASTTYYFRVKATNANGSSNWSNTVIGTTAAAPTGGAFLNAQRNRFTPAKIRRAAVNRLN